MPPTLASGPAPSGTAAPRSRTAAALGLLAWIGVLVGVIVGFSALGSGPLAPPALTDPGAWGEWAAGRDPVLVTFTVLRLVVLALAWYLLGVTVVGSAARLLRWGRLVTVADLLTVPSVRRLLQSTLGLGLATAALTAVPTASMEPSEPTAAHVELAAQRDAAPAIGGSYASMTPLEPGGPTAVMRVVGVDAEEAAQPAHWELEPGQHLWSVAEAVLAAAWERPPSDAEIVPYWQTLIEENRDVLVDPGNPDLVYPGQVLTLPPPPAPSAQG